MLMDKWSAATKCSGGSQNKTGLLTKPKRPTRPGSRSNRHSHVRRRPRRASCRHAGPSSGSHRRRARRPPDAPPPWVGREDDEGVGGRAEQLTERAVPVAAGVTLPSRGAAVGVPERPVPLAILEVAVPVVAAAAASEAGGPGAARARPVPVAHHLTSG